MHKIAASLVGAASVSASLLVLRPLPPGALSRTTDEKEPCLRGIHAGEKVPAEISLRRLRELGL